MKKWPIVFGIILSFLLSIAAAVALHIYQEGRIRQIESSLAQMGSSEEEPEGETPEVDEGLPEFEDVKVLTGNSKVYFDPKGTTYHSSKECPMIEGCDELAVAKRTEAEREANLFPCAVCIIS